MISISTWNVNSVRSRLPHLLDWLKNDAPDIVLLQELKCVDEAFPTLEIEELGYNVATHGQKTYNGVAILSKFPLDDILCGLPGNEEDEQARYIEAVVNLSGEAMRVASVYVPNGSTIDDDKFQYKQRFLTHLLAHVKTLIDYDEMLVIGGDYNIAPDDIDVHDPDAWKDSVLTHLCMKQQFRLLCNAGLCDAYRMQHPTEHEESYSWWDYRAAGYARNHGLRIDHLLMSAQAADKITDCLVVKELRGREKPSDHAPVLASLAIA